MSFALSRSLIRAAEMALSNRDRATPADSSPLIPVAGTPFFLGRRELIRARDDFLVYGFIKDPVTEEEFAVGHPARAVR